MRNKFIRAFTSSNAAAANLICFAHAGGGASRYRAWHSELDQLVNLFLLFRAVRSVYPAILI